MKPLLAFWKRDIINKLIVIAILALAGGALAFAVLIFNMPYGKSLSESFTNFLPQRGIPTLGVNNIPALPTATEVVFFLPTFTPPPPMPTVDLSTPTLELLPTLALEESPTQPLDLPTQSASGGLECIPNNPPRTGTVVEILDGNTVRVLIDKLIYVVRYAGVAAPEDKNYGAIAKAENSKLVYGKEVTLVADVSDKDPRGRLLRYVVQGNTFINRQLIQQGFDSALDTPPDSACAEVFKQAQQSASAALTGMWSPIATP